MSGLLAEQTHSVLGLAPVADAFSGTVYSDIVDMSEYNRVKFVQITGVGTTGTSTITVEASSDNAGTAVSAVPFYSRSSTSPDTEGALTARTTAGYTTTAGSNRIEEIEVRADALAASGYRYVRAKFVEVVDSPVLGGILIELGEPRYRPGIASVATD